MRQSIEDLLKLADQFPVRKRIDYDNQADRVFANEVFSALSRARSDIRELAASEPLSDRFERVERVLNAISGIITSQFPVPVTVSSPSNGEQPAPETEHSSRNQAESPKTGGNDASSGQKEGSSGTSASSDATPGEKKKAAKVIGRPFSRASGRTPSEKPSVAPQEAPPATGEGAISS